MSITYGRDQIPEEDVLYHDDEIVIALKDRVLAPGQITIFPKEKYTIMEMVPEAIIKKCAIVAKKLSAAVFEGQGAQATNVLIQNGVAAGQKVPHFSVEIIPRREQDALPLIWDPKPMGEDDLDILSEQLKEQVGQIVKPGGDIAISKGAPKNEPASDDKENYLLKSIRRLP